MFTNSTFWICWISSFSNFSHYGFGHSVGNRYTHIKPPPLLSLKKSFYSYRIKTHEYYCGKDLKKSQKLGTIKYWLGCRTAKLIPNGYSHCTIKKIIQTLKLAKNELRTKYSSTYQRHSPFCLRKKSMLRDRGHVQRQKACPTTEALLGDKIHLSKDVIHILAMKLKNGALLEGINWKSS